MCVCVCVCVLEGGKWYARLIVSLPHLLLFLVECLSSGCGHITMVTVLRPLLMRFIINYFFNGGEVACKTITAG